MFNLCDFYCIIIFQNKHQQKTRNSEIYPILHHKRNELNNEQAAEVKSNQRVMLDMGYHGKTFVNDLDSVKTLAERLENDHMPGRNVGTTPSSAARLNASKSFKLMKSEESQSGNSISMLPVHSTKSIRGLDLAAKTAGHRDMPIEEQARNRNLRRHASLNSGTAGAYLRGIQNSKDTLNMIFGSNQFALSTPALESRDSDQHSYFQQFSTNSSQTKLQSSDMSRIKSSQHNVEFQSGASKEQVTTQADSSSHSSSREDKRQESGKVFLL